MAHWDILAPLSVDRLIELALDEHRSEDSSKSCAALVALQARGTTEVLQAAIDLSKSRLAHSRILATYILGELGLPIRSFPEECCDVLIEMLRAEKDAHVTSAIVFALGHLGHRRCLPHILPFATAGEKSVRHAVAFALCGTIDPGAVQVLLSLMDDPYERARDWATTSIGQMLEVDSATIRESLLRRAADPDEFVRAEAITGLARRKDARVVPYLISEITRERETGYLFVDAAKNYLSIEDKEDISIQEILNRLESMGNSDFVDAC